MYTIRYSCGGRLGNCIFPYTICVIFQILYNFKYVTEPEANECVINDENFKAFFTEEMLREELKNGGLLKPKNNIVLIGYFQHDYIFRICQELVKAFIYKNPQMMVTPSNHESQQFSNEILYKDYLPSINFSTEDVIFHIRLEDYLNDIDNPNGFKWIVDLNCYKKILSDFSNDFKVNIKNVFWVMKQPNSEIELLYIRHLLKNVGGVYKSQSLLEDFSMMRKAKNLICSASTLSWMAAAYSAGCQNIYIPKHNTEVHAENNFKYLNEKSKVYNYEVYNSYELNRYLIKWKEDEN